MKVEDNVLLFCRAVCKPFETLCKILNVFCQFFVICLNVEKSHISFSKCMEDADATTGFIGFSVCELLFSYLNILITRKLLISLDCYLIINALQAILIRWDGRSLS